MIPAALPEGDAPARRAAATATDVAPGRRALLLAAALAVLFFILYVKTACRGPYWQDAGIYLRSVYLLGNCYAPGYPAYLSAAYIFTALPGLSAVVGLNLFSAVAGAAAAFFVALVALRLYARGPFAGAGAAVAVLILGTAPAVWAQATVTEVYTLNLALAAATVLALLAWGGGADNRPLYAAAFLYGLACGAHPLQAVFLPAYLLYAVITGGRRVLSVATAARAVGLFALALSAYLYLPLRSAAGILPDWGMPRTLGNFYRHVTGAAYRAEYFGATAALGWARARMGAAMFRSQFGWLGLAAGLAGAAWLWARRPRAAALLFVVAAGPLAFVWFYYSANWRTWYTPLYLAWALAAGAAAAWFAGLAARVKVALGIIVAAAAVAVALTTFPGRFGPADKSYFPYAEDAAGNVLRPVGPKATFILSTEGSAVAGPLAALVTAARARPDVRFVDAAGTRQFEDFMARVEEVRRARPGTAEEDAYIRAFMGLVAAPAREYYVLFPFAPAYASGYRYESRGGVLKLLRPGETRTRRDWWALARRRGLGPGETNYIDYWTATFESNSYLNEARARFAAGDTRRAALCLARAERLGARSELAQNNLGAYAEARGDDKAAAAHYRRALALEPTYERPRRNLVMLYYRVGEGEKARAELETWDRMFGGKPATSGRR